MESIIPAVADIYLDAIMIFDDQLALYHANKQALRIAECSLEELLSKKYADLFQGAPAISMVILEGMPAGLLLDHKGISFRRASGKMLPVNARFIAVQLSTKKSNATDQPRGLLVSFTADPPQKLNATRQLPDLAGFGIISCGISLHHIQTSVYDIAQSDSSVLILGETGTGKELLANVIHSLSPRRDGPLIKINCGAIPENLLEAELFGYKRGAFTDARNDKPGRFQLAHGGTIVLDEIGDMPLGLQVKLLRVIETRQIDPLGSVHPEFIDVRIVSSTNNDLWELTENGNFRRDLFFRINVLSLHIPPLRERVEDIPLLAESYLRGKAHTLNKTLVKLVDSTLEILICHYFHGNVRELHNILEHAMVLCKGSTLLPEHLPHYVLKASGQQQAIQKSQEASLIRSVLDQCHWNKNDAAKVLGVHRSTLWRKIQNLGIYREK